MSYQQHRIKHIRGHILYFLKNQSQVDAVLLLALEDMGLALPRDMLSGVLTWLEQSGFIKLKIQDDITIASITQSGFDIVKNRTRHPEIIMNNAVI